MAKAEDTYISYSAALRILMQGDYTEAQAKIILSHSHGKRIEGADYYPMRYIYKRAAEQRAKPD